MDISTISALVGAVLAAVPGAVTISVLIFRHGREMACLRAAIDKLSDSSVESVEFVELRACVEANTATCRRHQDEITVAAQSLSKAKKKIWRELNNDRG